MNKDKHSIALLENSNSCHLNKRRKGGNKQKKGTKTTNKKRTNDLTCSKLNKFDKQNEKSLNTNLPGLVGHALLVTQYP